MKRTITTIIAILGLFRAATASAQTGVWTTNVATVSSRALGAAATIGGKIYMVGGGNYSCGVNSALQAYDPVANAWTNLANMPTARYEFGATDLNGQLYAIGGNPGCGSAGSAIRAVEAYDPVSNVWSSKALLPTGSWGESVATANGKIYVIDGFTNYVYAYDPSGNSWSLKTPSPAPCSFGVVAAVNGLIYIIGAGGAGPQAGVYAYNPLTDSWAAKASMPTARYASAGAAVNGIIYVAGGFSNTGAVATVEAYNPATDTWSTGTPLPFRVWGASATAINGTLYVIGGFDVNNATIGSVEAFTPATSIAAINMYAGLTIIGVVGSTNRIDFKPDLATTNWTAMTNLVLPFSPYLFIDTNSPNSTKGFYRVVQL
jgi:N-acetylneuraminic acid mutarotase